MYVRSFDEAPFDRKVSIFNFGDYPQALKAVNPKKGEGPVFFTTMDPLPGLLVVDYVCAEPSDQCDISEKNAYDHTNSTTKQTGPE